MRTYEVQFTISGPIKLDERMDIRAVKELNIGQMFDSQISIRKEQRNNVIRATVRAENVDRAEKVAGLFVGKMLDVLTVLTNCNLELHSYERRGIDRDEQTSVRAIVNIDEVSKAFEIARRLNTDPSQSKMLRAYSWYRKGLNTDNSLDRFLSFWNSISVICDEFAEDNEQTKLGIINRIWNCFNQLWSDCKLWPIIPGNRDWIKEHNVIRNEIAHGGVSVDVDYVNKVLDRLDTLEKMSYLLIKGFSRNLNIEI